MSLLDLPNYCLGFVPDPELVFDPVGSKAPEILDRIDSISERSIGLAAFGAVSPLAGTLEDAAVGVLPVAGGVPPFDDPPDG
jgi:hypothetical protein